MNRRGACPGVCLALVALLILGEVNAQEQRAEVAIQTGTAGTLWTGEQVVLDLDLKTPALSFADVHFNLPEVPGALVLQTDTTTVKLSEQRDGETWQVLRYPITVFPQQAGELSVPAFEVRFRTSSGFGSEPVSHQLQTQPLTLQVRQPPGLAAGQVAVTTSRLQLTSDWDLPPGTLQTGDAVTLTVERQAAGISAMLLPPLPVAGQDGLAAYPADPDVDDRTNRGSLTGVRRDRITWIVEQPGDYTLPAIVFRSWDPAREQLKTHRVEGVRFSAELSPQQVAAPADAASTERTGSGLDLLRTGFVLLLVSVLGALAWHFRSLLRHVARTLSVRILPPARALLKTLNPGAPS